MAVSFPDKVAVAAADNWDIVDDVAVDVVANAAGPGPGPVVADNNNPNSMHIQSICRGDV